MTGGRGRTLLQEWARKIEEEKRGNERHAVPVHVLMLGRSEVDEKSYERLCDTLSTKGSTYLSRRLLSCFFWGYFLFVFAEELELL